MGNRKRKTNDIENQRKYYILQCPECENNTFKKEWHTMETYCLKCGLVIVAPPSCDFITDGFNKIQVSRDVYYNSFL